MFQLPIISPADTSGVVSLRSVNLNLLPILQAILREQNLSRAADALGLTQPAVSAALTRLRAVLEDPILIRRGRGMELTLRAHEMIEAVEELCTAIEHLMGSTAFDPFDTDRRFVIASADYVIITLAPVLIRELSKVAPKASLHFIDIPHPAVEQHPGEVDFFIVPELLFTEGRFLPLRRTRLIDDEFVTVVANDSTLGASGEPSRADLLSAHYALYYPALSLVDPTLVGALNGTTKGRKITAQIQQFSLLPVLAIETGLATIVPRRIADYLKKFMPIRLIEDGPLPVPLNLSLAWNASLESDPAHRWLRQLIMMNCTSLNDTATASAAGA